MFIVLRQLETALRAMKNYIDKIVPRKVSDLQNDAEYITENDVPTSLSEFTNDAGFITESDISTPDWTATSSEPGYIDNKPNILPGTGQMSIQTNAGHTVTGTQSASFGAQNNVSGNLAFSVGVQNNVSGGEAFAAGNNNIANHESQFVFGQFNAADPSNTESSMRGTYIEIVGNGDGTTIGGEVVRSNARTLDWEGNQWIAGNMKVGGTGYDDSNAVEVATKNDIATPDWEAAEGEDGYIDNKPDLHAGSGTNSIRNSSSTASGNYSHAEGAATTASGHQSHAEGALSTASGINSHAEGIRTIANHKSQHVFGEYNIEDPSTAAATARGNYVEIIGNGSLSTPSNARTLDWSGNEWLSGTLKVGGTGYIDSNAKEVATKDYVDTAIADIDVSGSKIISGTWTTPQSSQPYLDYDDSAMTDETLMGLLNDGELVTLKVSFPDVNSQTDTRYFYLKGKTTYEESYSMEGFIFWSIPSVGESGSTNYVSILVFMHAYNSSINTYMWNYDEMPFPVKDVTVNGTSVVNNGVAEIPVASNTVAGVIKVDGNGLAMTTGDRITVVPAPSSYIKAGTDNFHFASVKKQHESVFYGLAKAAGDATQASSSNAVGTYTDEAKTAIKSMLGIVSDIDDTAGSGDTNVTWSADKISSELVNSENIKIFSGTWVDSDAPSTTPSHFEFDDSSMADADFYNLVNNDNGKTVFALYVDFPDKYQVQTIKQYFYLDGKQDNYLLFRSAALAGAQYGRCFNSFIAFSCNTYVDPYTYSWSYGVDSIDVQVDNNSIIHADVANIESNKIAFNGLAKAAGDTSQASSGNPIGTYTDTAKTKIKAMLGVTDPVSEIDDTAGSGDTDKTWSADKITSELANAGSVQDVTVNGTSVVGQDGVAEIPVASTTNLGVVKYLEGRGIGISPVGFIFVTPTTSAQIKNPSADASAQFKPVTPFHQHESAFYGLAKAAGDTTQSASSNAVGTYTDNAKASIKAMLGVGADQTQTVLVDGTAPVITAVANARYICGEVLSVDFTAPAAGICELVFTSGSTVAVLTITGVMFPEWFDSTTLETNTVYEISIADGRAVVATWDAS